MQRDYTRIGFFSLVSREINWRCVILVIEIDLIKCRQHIWSEWRLYYYFATVCYSFLHETRRDHRWTQTHPCYFYGMISWFAFMSTRPTIRSACLTSNMSLKPSSSGVKAASETTREGMPWRQQRRWSPLPRINLLQRPHATSLTVLFVDPALLPSPTPVVILTLSHLPTQLVVSSTQPHFIIIPALSSSLSQVPQPPSPLSVLAQVLMYEYQESPHCVTGTKNHVLYYAYIEMCRQLDPHGLFNVWSINASMHNLILTGELNGWHNMRLSFLHFSINS